MKFMPKFYPILLVISVFFVFSFHNVSAQISITDLDSSLLGETGITKSIDKIIFAKVKRQQIFKNSGDKYAREFAYFFHKVGFKSSPAAYVLFEGGEAFNINKNWQVNQFSNDLDKGVLFVLLVYDNEFNISKFDSSLKNFANEVREAAPTMNLESVDSVEIKDFIIERDESNLPKIVFKDSDNIALAKPYFSGINFKERGSVQLAIDSIKVPELAEYNTKVKAKITLKNNSKFDLIYSAQNSIQLTVDKESPLYSSTWAAPKTPLVLKDGFIKANSTGEYEVEMVAPLLPGRITENLSLSIKDKIVDTKPISMVVKDDGQKILRIKPTELGYLTIRKESKIDSAEIGRAPIGNLYIYTDLQNSFYKVKFDDKEGWIFSKYIEVIK